MVKRETFSPKVEWGDNCGKSVTVVSTYICIQVYVHQQIHAQSSYTYIHTKILVKTMKRKENYD